MKKNRKKRQPEAAAPQNPSIQPAEEYSECLSITIEPPSRMWLELIVIQALEEAKPEEAYESGVTPPLTYYGWNANTNEVICYQNDPADQKITLGAFDAQCCRLHRKIKATHLAYVVPLGCPNSPGCEAIVVFAQSSEEQLVVAMQVCRDNSGYFVGLSEPITMPFLAESEWLIEEYFNQNAAKAPAVNIWNYIPGNN